jgi:hypothetical protein
MANVCTNEVFITTNDISNYSYLLKKLEYELVSDVYHTTEEDIEATFESKWDFPLHKFINITENLPNKKDKSLYIRVFSYEHGNYYHEYNVYTIEKDWVVH